MGVMLAQTYCVAAIFESDPRRIAPTPAPTNQRSDTVSFPPWNGRNWSANFCRQALAFGQRRAFRRTGFENARAVSSGCMKTKDKNHHDHQA
jgi:hypothetical protein